jgi:hypothetical protein
VPSTYAAAFFLTLLNQMLQVLGLSSALQFIVFGFAIVAGMIISGDRIITFVENVLQYVIDPLSRSGETDEKAHETRGGNLPSPG